MKIKYLWAKMIMKARGKAIWSSHIEKTAFINSGSNIVNCNIGSYTYLGYDCWAIETTIGSYCSISNNVRIGGPAHPMQFVSTSPVFHKGHNVLKKNFAQHDFNPYVRTIIGNDVWIGECAMIKAGVKIGNGAIVGMGSVVTKDIGDYEIWAGNPARCIRKRFTDEIISSLNTIQWWDKSDAWLEELAPYFNLPEDFIKESTKE